jgi:hypothetical protein
MSILGRNNGSFQRYLLKTEKICNLKQLSVIADISHFADPEKTTIHSRYLFPEALAAQ